MSPETIAAAVAALIAVGAGLRKAKEVMRDDGAVSSVVDMLRQEVSRLRASYTALQVDHDRVMRENMTLRKSLEDKDREAHACYLELNKLRYKETDHERCDSTR